MRIGPRYNEREHRQEGWTLFEFNRDINGRKFTFYRYINQPQGLPDTVGVELPVEGSLAEVLHAFHFGEQQGMFTVD